MNAAPPARGPGGLAPSLPVRATLRPYQLTGVDWLLWVDDTGPGGVLGDDMGLGKTLQCIAAMALLHRTRPSLRVLVIAPTSLVHNWCSELRKFAPQLSVAAWTGLDRKRNARAVFAGRGFHVVVTSYAIARIDAPLLASLPAFDWLLLDEAQSIKNAASSTYAMAASIPARRRIALTGTPIENGVEDLHALFSWAVPGLLGPLPWFVETYSTALSDGDRALADRVQRIVHPYLLRRKKVDVAKDLPTKTEHVRLVELPTQQRVTYDAIHAAAYRALANTGDDRKARMAIFQAILKLRQVACDPRLLGIPYEASGKLRALVTLVLDAKKSGRKTLVFSTFAEMIKLLASDLDKWGIGSVVLTGDVPQDKRAALIRQFETDPKKDVFLITLKAGGVGLNLVAASRVVHYDPWWNPASEDQATDRAYRIGQTKAVDVWRLLAKNTIEEHVAETLDEKRDLAGLILGDKGETGPAFAHAVRELRALLGRGIVGA